MPDGEKLKDVFQVLHSLKKKCLLFWWIPCFLAVLATSGAILVQRITYQPIYRTRASFSVLLTQSEAENTQYSFYYDKLSVSRLSKVIPVLVKSKTMEALMEEKQQKALCTPWVQVSFVEDSNLFTIVVFGETSVQSQQLFWNVVEQLPQVCRHVIGETKFELLTTPVSDVVPYQPVFQMIPMLAAMLAGGMAGMGLLLFSALQCDTIQNQEDVLSKLQLELLASFPKGIHENRNYSDRKQEQIRIFGIRMLRKLTEKAVHTVLITSALGKEGKTVCAKQLTELLKTFGKKALYVDGALDGTGAKSQVEWQYRIEKQKENWDYVIIDAPACKEYADACEWAQYVDGVVLVTAFDETDMRNVQAGLQNLKAVHANLLGCILNKRSR